MFNVLQPSTGRIAPACPIDVEIDLGEVSAAQAARLAYAQRAYSAALERAPGRRCLEAEALIRASARLHDARRACDPERLRAALDYTLQVWRVLTASAAEEPAERRTDGQTRCLAMSAQVFGVAARCAATGLLADVEILIGMNKDLARGMRAGRS